MQLKEHQLCWRKSNLWMSKYKGVKKIALTIGSLLTIGVSGTLFVKYGFPYIKKKFKKTKKEEKWNKYYFGEQ